MERPEYLDERWTPFEEAAYQLHDLMIRDILWWSAETMNWRFRFEFKRSSDADVAAQRRRNNAWLEKQVRKHCSGGTKITGLSQAIYLQSNQDARQLFQLFGTTISKGAE